MVSETEIIYSEVSVLLMEDEGWYSRLGQNSGTVS
jgi:hypothetical protein